VCQLKEKNAVMPHLSLPDAYASGVDPYLLKSSFARSDLEGNPLGDAPFDE
jgi:hypothetical protein